MNDEPIIESKEAAYKRALAQAKILAKKNGWTVDQALAVTWGQPRPARSGNLDDLNTYAKGAAARAKASMYGEMYGDLPPELGANASEINRRIEAEIKARAKQAAQEAEGFMFPNGGRPRADDLIGGVGEPVLGAIQMTSSGDPMVWNGSVWIVLPAPEMQTQTTNGTLPGIPEKLTLEAIQKAYDEAMRGTVDPPAAWGRVPDSTDWEPRTQKKNNPVPKPKPTLEKPAPRAIRFEEE